jgi:uncharacterized protein
MERMYAAVIKDHFARNRQMAFLSGPRQVGKTSLAKSIDPVHVYANWDNQNDRINITKGPDFFAEFHTIKSLDAMEQLVILDEIHKYGKWKQFLKGFFDSFGDTLRILVTGSARLNIYKKSGDSLMGRYFNYRLHPVSVAETMHSDIANGEIRAPKKISDHVFDDLIEYGGFPEPLLRAERRFYNKWKRLRSEQFFHEDMRDLTRINEIALIETFADILRHQSGQLLNYLSIANSLNISVDTVKRWLGILENMYYCFTVKPYFKNIPKSLRKQPKLFLWDWSLLSDRGQRSENMIASHLLKAVHFWTDNGYGEYDLWFLRDKMKREVDFLVTRNKAPWLLVEAKSSSLKQLSAHLEYYSKLLHVKHAFQVELSGQYVDKDCFAASTPIRVPAKTFLSQLV